MDRQRSSGTTQNAIDGSRTRVMRPRTIIYAVLPLALVTGFVVGAGEVLTVPIRIRAPRHVVSGAKPLRIRAQSVDEAALTSSAETRFLAPVNMREALLHQIGRVSGYASAGALFGWVGGALQSWVDLPRMAAILRLALSKHLRKSTNSCSTRPARSRKAIFWSLQP